MRADSVDNFVKCLLVAELFRDNFLIVADAQRRNLYQVNIQHRSLA